jgi:glycosyltransferase involved in cell wall biosynthesis
VIFPTFNRSDVVRRTLEHILHQDYPPELMEIIVCDNSSDDTPEMVQSLAAAAPVSVLLLRSEERLPAVKRNQGLRAASGDLALFINDDVWLRSDALRVHANAHSEHEGPVAVVGHVEQSRQMPRLPFIEWYRPFAYDRIASRAAKAVPYQFFWSMNLSLPRNLMLERQLVFHEDWANIGHEDVELGYRWTQAGYPVVYRPDAWGEHFHPHDLASACRLQYSVGRGLRDLQALIPEDDLLERYGVVTLRSSPRRLSRGFARKALFNRWTVPALERRLNRLDRRNRLAEWSYWKIMLHHTERGWREQPARRPMGVPTLPERA